VGRLGTFPELSLYQVSIITTHTGSWEFHVVETEVIQSIVGLMMEAMRKVMMMMMMMMMMILTGRAAAACVIMYRLARWSGGNLISRHNASSVSALPDSHHALS
jgi:hypothetical protein